MVEAWTDRTAFAFLVRTMILTLHFPLMELYFLRPGAPPPLTLSHSSPGALRVPRTRLTPFIPGS